jgi:hypothetical protein
MFGNVFECSCIHQSINSQQDLVQIMNIGNELYSYLSQLSGQSLLMFSELPTELTVFDTDYILENSEIEL